MNNFEQKMLILKIIIGLILAFPATLLLKLLHNWFTRANEIIKILESIDKKLTK